MGLSVEEDRAVRVETLKAKYSDTILKADQFLSEANANAIKASLEKDYRSVEETNKNRPLRKENKSSSVNQHQQTRRILGPKKPQQSKALKVLKRPPNTDVPKFMTFNDREKVAEVEREAEAILMKRRRRQEIERLRLAARIEINNFVRTVVFDNVGVMKEFEKLVGPRASEIAYGSLLV